MKKTYIKPETLVVAINMEALIAVSPLQPLNEQTEYYDPTQTPGTNGGHTLAREVIQSPDAWDNEW